MNTNEVFQTKHNKSNLISTLILGTFLLFSMLTNAQQKQSQNKDVGVFDFEEEVIDYGTITQNDNGLRTFVFTNRGRAPIVISKVKTTCGCTIPTYPKKAILPGETASIDIKYATNRLGVFSKTITVMSNADQPQKKLRIKGNVISKQISKL